ncbi:hypothetical protein C8R48DRAFT_193031 [Suillus tomentosus]|nr:hypothetical protein C8R48DRAFT_193031 [Suillus tomentosus]
MDDDSAEIELLEQNLNKTHQISQRVTSILTNFDTRLVKLEKSSYHYTIRHKAGTTGS